MNFAAVLLLLVSADSFALKDGAAAAAAAEPKKDRKICRRVDATESRVTAKRVCKTAKEWKAQQNDTDEAGVERAKQSL